MASPIEHEDSCEQVQEQEAAEEPKAPKIRDTPEDIKLEAIINTIAFHPSRVSLSEYYLSSLLKRMTPESCECPAEPCSGQHAGESIEEIQLVKFWDISSLPDTRVSDYRRRKKKDRRLKALSNKAFDTGQDFFAGLLDSTEENSKKQEEEEEEEEEEDDSVSGSD